MYDGFSNIHSIHKNTCVLASHVNHNIYVISETVGFPDLHKILQHEGAGIPGKLWSSDLRKVDFSCPKGKTVDGRNPAPPGMYKTL